MACTLLEITSTAGGMDAAEAWRRIAGTLVETLPPDTPFEINDVPRKLSKVGDYVAKARVAIFDAVGAGYEFHFAFGGPRDAEMLRVQRADGRGIDGDLWVSRLTESDRLLAAYLADREYELWQNMHDPRYYALHGRSLDGLTLIPDEGPPPRQVIDTSRHPGRRVFRNGYVEAVGAVMWLGRPFAGVTEADLDALRAADWCRVEEVRPGTLRVRAQESCFTSAEGPEAELQGRLRAALFPVAKERFPKRQKRARPS